LAKRLLDGTAAEIPVYNFFYKINNNIIGELNPFRLHPKDRKFDFSRPKTIYGSKEKDQKYKNKIEVKMKMLLIDNFH